MDAHEREGQAAVAAMDTRPLRIGDRVTGVSGGRRFSGTLVAVQGDRCDVEIDVSWVTCRRCEIERIEEGPTAEA